MEMNYVSGMVVDSAIRCIPLWDQGSRRAHTKRAWYGSCASVVLHVESQVPSPVRYDGETLDIGYRSDLLVEGCVLVELKSIENLLPIHQAQLLSYLRLIGKEVGLLINFNVEHLKNGIKRVINSRPEFSVASAL